MKTSMEWLAAYLPQAPSAAEAAEALTHGGLPVEVIETFGEDTVIDVEVTSNRSDCLSHLGVARELGALLDRPVQEVQPRAAESGAATADRTSVHIEAAYLCPHYTARILRNVKVAPSPAWMVRRLEAVGLRSINNVVDVTNYVMFELGQPLHAFDLDKLRGNRIIVRKANAGEKITSIDGKERILQAGMLVIADEERPVALAGVMGGLDTEVSATTVNVLLESARFDPLSVRKTARTLAMDSPSSYRFERGIDPALPPRASLRAAELILQTAGGELMRGLVEAGQAPSAPKKLSLRMEQLRQVLGVSIESEKAVAALRRLRLQPQLSGDRVDVTVPTDRLDLNLEIDLVEEVARLIGYAAIPVRAEISIRVVSASPDAAAVEMVRSTLLAGGFFEAVTFSFVTDALATAFADPAHSPALLRADPMVRKADARLRPSILPGLLEAIVRNENAGVPDAKFFEIGSVFATDAAGKIKERRRVALAGGDLRPLRGMVEALLHRLDADRPLRIMPQNHTGFAPGACALVRWGETELGHLGLLDLKIAATLSLRHSPALAELNLPPLISGAQHVPQLKPLPRYPAVRRDLSLVVDDAMPYAKLESLIDSQRPADLEGFEYVTTYRGKPLNKEQKSLTITLVFRSPTATLTAEQVESSVTKLVEAARKELGAELRG